MQTITRKGTFDSCHRVMNEKMKCFNLHGHTYLYELTFKFNTIESIGYAIDFKEIKRVACQYIDDMFDHGTLVNPKDEIVLRACYELNSKYWVMMLNGGEYCNPTVENIAKEIYILVSALMLNYRGLALHEVKLYETPNCFTVCTFDSVSDSEWTEMQAYHNESITEYANEKGQQNYDDRK